MPEVTPLEAAINNARQAEALATQVGQPDLHQLFAARSWHAFLDHVAATWSGADLAPTVLDPGLVESITNAVRLLPRVESLEVRADLAEALGHKLEITSEEPDPGRDWGRVEAHLFKPSGKWMYQVWLDYTDERHRGGPGEGPAGWHFAGAAMAERALARATDNNTSGVTIRELGTYWHLFVPNPPQGYPLWVRPALAENENQLTWDHFQQIRERCEELDGRAQRDGERAQQYFEQMKATDAKLDAIREIVEDYGGGADIPDSVILEVLDR